VKLAAVALVLAGAGCSLLRGPDTSKCPTRTIVELGLQEDVRKIAGCPRTGGIVIRTGASLDVTPLRELEEIDGDLSIGPTVGVDTVAFNGLLRVSGTIRVVSNSSLRGLFLPRLESAGRIEVENNVVLTTISVPRLVTVANALVVSDNAGLELMSAGALVNVAGELVITDHPKLGLVELPRLTGLQTVRIENNPKLPAELVSKLQATATGR
jgi:hypothetical protein